MQLTHQKSRGWLTCLVAIVVVLLLLSSIDAIRNVPPLADDWWMMREAPGHLTKSFLAQYGPLARPIGLLVLDALITIRKVTGSSVLAAVLAVRATTLALTYIVLRRAFSLSVEVALFTLAVFALTPPASEAWSLLCNSHLALSAPLLLLTCAAWARAIQQATSEKRAAHKAIALSVVLQVVGYALYEQSLLAVPTFVAVILVFEFFQHRGNAATAARLVGISGATAVTWAIGAFLSGYVGQRTAAVTGAHAAVELTDFTASAKYLWIGFVEHHVWRLVEMYRLHRVSWWDHTLAGVVAAASTLVLSMVVGAAMLWRGRHRVGRQPECDGIAPGPVALSCALLAAAFAAILLVEFATPGSHLFSRLLYQPGALVALAIGVQLPAALRRRQVLVAIGASSYILWCGVVQRRYVQDLRDGSRMMREVASTLSSLPNAVTSEGVLVIAQSNVGTFSSTAVERWSLRPAIVELGGHQFAGPLYLSESCPTATSRTVIDERGRAVEGEPWHEVARFTSGRVFLTSSVEAACRSKPDIRMSIAPAYDARSRSVRR